MHYMHTLDALHAPLEDSNRVLRVLQVLLDTFNRHLASVEDPGSQGRLRGCPREQLREVLRLAGPTGCDHRKVDKLAHHVHQLQVVPLALPVTVDGVEQDLACSESLARDDEGSNIKVRTLPATRRSTLKPAVTLPVRSFLLGLDHGVFGVGGLRSVHSSWVNGDNHSLCAVDVRNALDRRRHISFFSVFVEFYRGTYGIAPD
mmetsp:Transcript_572/g.1097  ORF Transcript_572/g.1097 Transcript_572/m.1097 type:complete len:203 (-) Transcript_572:1126-1734(-)